MFDKVTDKNKLIPFLWPTVYHNPCRLTSALLRSVLFIVSFKRETRRSCRNFRHFRRLYNVVLSYHRPICQQGLCAER